MGDNNIISNLPTFNEGILVRGNEAIHNGFESVDKKFGYYFVGDIAKADWTKLRDFFRRGDFRN